MNEDYLLVLSFLGRALSIIFCVNRADKLNRIKLIWGGLALCFPLIMAVAILFMNKIDPEDLDKEFF